jgi:beta-lactamase class A
MQAIRPVPRSLLPPAREGAGYRRSVDRLQDDLAGLIAASGGDAVAVAYVDLRSGDHILIEPDLPFHPASVFKVCVLMEIHRQAKTGAFGLDDSIEVGNSFRSIADGSAFSVRAKDDSESTLYDRIGSRATIRELAGLMITRSSNLATNILIALVTAPAVTTFMHELGASGLEVLRGPEDNVAYARGFNNVVTARGLLVILDRLARREVVSEPASIEMIELMSRQTFNDGISRPLPEDAVVAHKTGWNDRLYHDAAIVYPPGATPYVLVVLTRGLPEETEGPALVQAISAAVFRAR